MTPIPERILEEAYRLAKASIFHGGVDWAAGDIAKALAAAEQRGREMEREECSKVAEAQIEEPGLSENPAYVRFEPSAKMARKIAAAIRSRSEGKGE